MEPVSRDALYSSPLFPAAGDPAHQHHRVTFADQGNGSSGPYATTGPTDAHAPGVGADLEAQRESAFFTDAAANQPHNQVIDEDPLGNPVTMETQRSKPIPLSEVKLPVSALAPNSCDEKRDHHKRNRSGDSGSSKTGKTGKSTGSGISRFLKEQSEPIQEAAHNFKMHVNHPQQVTSPRTKSYYQHVLAWVGRIGWCGKAVVYAMIGGLACHSAAHDPTPTPNESVTGQISASPQGAFVLLGTTPGGAGANIAILLIMLVALCSYILWRFWEGLAGQGYDRTFSSKKNFFKFRISPIVSGCVYCSYLVFILELLDHKVRDLPDQGSKETWPATWRHTDLGRAGLALMGLAFIIATCIQLQGVLTKLWHKDYRSDLHPRVMKAVLIIGHIGFVGRGAAFLSLAILFIKDASGVGINSPDTHAYSMVANALQQLQQNRGTRAILMIIGILLVTYGLFATLSAWARVFPTPSPSRERPVPFSVVQECEDKSLPPPEVEQCELAGEEAEQLPRDVYEREVSSKGGHCATCGAAKCENGCAITNNHHKAAAPEGKYGEADGMDQVDTGAMRPQANGVNHSPRVDAVGGEFPANGRANNSREGYINQDWVSIDIR